MGEQPTAKVAHDVGGGDGGEVAALVSEDLREPGAVYGGKRGHVGVARGAELRTGLCLCPTVRHLVVGVEQPVGVADELQSGPVVVLQPVADVQVEQLGGQQRAAVDALHRPADGRRMGCVGDQLFKIDPDGAHRHADVCLPTQTADAKAGGTVTKVKMSRK